jgi:UDP-N-acetylmuramoyl-tripeptide--D-alanyl-D-alanine ligase
VSSPVPKMWTASWVANACEGQLVGPDRELRGVTIDSRSVPVGSLFVPLIGERDGHDFIDAARNLGTAATLTMRPAEHDGDIVVADTAVALTALGRAARAALPDRVVGITGSSGKTSTKDLLAAIFRVEGPAAASEKSFNNELGVPLTLLNAPEDSLAAAIEMGARGIGHIATLCEVARPTVGVIVNIGTAHRELFASAEGTADAKSELYDSIPDSGASVVNLDDALFVRMRGHARGRVLTFSSSGRPEADVTASAITMNDELQATFDLRSPWGSAQVSLGARGLHQVENALAAATCALASGSTLDHVVAGLATKTLSPMRMDLQTTGNGLRVLNDAYNANPSSMRSALHALAQLDGRRRFALLGTMAELGPDKLNFHLEIGALARDLGITLAFGVNEQDYGLVNVTSIEDALANLGSLGSGDIVLVKGSRVAGLEKAVDALINANGGVAQ